MPSLFISYRRSDSPDTVKLIYERLKTRLPRWDVFYDHESIPLGDPFPERLRAKVTSACVVLVIIGPKWLQILHERKDAAVDHVRVEVQLALESAMSVVPVLVGHAVMPADDDLADFPDLQPLLQRHGRPVRPDPDFDGDLEPLIAHIKQFDSDEAIGATLADKYTLTAEIGHGGMGVVYRAEQKHPVKRTVAVKLIKPGMDSRDVLARFDAERQALAVMDHPNIAKVHDGGMTANGRPFFVMEYVKGVPITEYCDDKKLTPQQRLELFIPVCNAVQHAHQKGIIHRDIKPSNVLVEVIDGDPIAKVIDFGLAKALGHKLTDKTLYTEADKRVGTLEYSAPEQAAGRSFDVDTRSDIYSLGILLYELLTGAPPFTHAELLKIGEEEMRRVIREEEPAKPSKRLSSSGELPSIAANRQLEPKKLTRLVRGDLDWIVMKCLEKEQARRYETANQLGQELQRFLADEPVQAGPPSAAYRLRKFAQRHRAGLRTSAAVLTVLVALLAAIGWDRWEVNGSLRAAGLVRQVLDADIQKVPEIVDEMDPYRRWAEPQLRTAYAETEAAGNADRHLRASLALLPFDDGQKQYLRGRMLDAAPKEVLVLRQQLQAGQADEWLATLWQVVERPIKQPQRLRAACALALYDPENAQWAQARGPVVAQLVAENPVYLEYWLKGFYPVRSALRPALLEVYLDKREDRAAERGLATNFLADYFRADANVLAELLLDAEPKQFLVLAPLLHSHRESIVARMTEELKKKLGADVPEEKQTALAKRQARATEALLYLERTDAVWLRLKHSPDPTVRSYLVNGFVEHGVEAAILVRRLQVPEIELSERRALLLALGSYAPDRVPHDVRETLLQKLLDDYENHPDAGVHGSTEWLLRQWGCLREMRVIDKRLRGKAPEKRRWYVNGQGQTYTILPQGGPFYMGSPESKTDPNPDENRHLRKIPRSFALAAKEVTRAQFERFLEANPTIRKAFDANGQAAPLLKKYSPEAETPIVLVSWYLAAQYCNWLSKEEGVDKEQWCYPSDPNKIAAGMVLGPEFLDKTGYRLPTEAEWEYACRAGADTSRHYGVGEEMLRNYGWYMQTSPNRTQVVGRLRPNDWGLFDTYGNAWEWCHDEYKSRYATKEAGAISDIMDKNTTLSSNSRVLRGGSFGNHASLVRSAFRFHYVPAYRNTYDGFRAARTLPLGFFTSLRPAPEGARK